MSEPIITKKCCTCKEIKPISGFSKNKCSDDGLQPKCKQCASDYQKRYSKTETGKKAFTRYMQSEKGKKALTRYHRSEKGRASTKKWRNSEKRKCYNKAYRQSEAGKAAQRKSNRKTPLRKKARSAINNAVQKGLLPKTSDCQCPCGQQAEHYHHPDYSKPLDVIPVCCTCHGKLHRLVVNEVKIRR